MLAAVGRRTHSCTHEVQRLASAIRKARVRACSVLRMTHQRSTPGYEVRLFPPAQAIDWHEAGLEVHVRAKDSTRGRAAVKGLPKDGRVDVVTNSSARASVRENRCSQVRCAHRSVLRSMHCRVP